MIILEEEDGEKEETEEKETGGEKEERNLQTGDKQRKNK